MQLELDLLRPLAGPAGQDVDLETGTREEGDQHVRAAPATDDSYYLLLRFCHFQGPSLADIALNEYCFDPRQAYSNIGWQREPGDDFDLCCYRVILN
jgi:hypothetical protein